ncbi:hypothetical protein SPRG_11456 [Saprolegnia parasitica CBS 223.65]|uniref:Acyl carrier protein n=1 Tax=Saprolegnia parasitica (strain CBS 223.65) TaxID=695850 RepID=A0A067BXV7_SAPPC|nr:hypothetical protein SPRG_11456 [Saprolegnia parasitica CBS 223.65]KDO23364.1 hypothetical protein SPRG_11456 [Saprolegnia parasitica CBS 223.65]|eukprot:XP_012205855.1 hypothetical protein SPRG_11456 [Saprolegnia parasitica CBS 223.65]
MFARFAAPLVRSVAAKSAPRRFFASQTFLDRNEVSERVLSVIKNFDKVEAAKVQETAKFVEDLGLDSLDVVEVVMAMEEEFIIEIPDNEAERLLTPAQVIDYVAAHPMAK